VELAIVGLKAVLPNAMNESSFWSQLKDKKSVIEVISQQRWELLSEASRNRIGDREKLHGMFLNNIDAFDRKLFGFSPAALIFSDPRQRLLLQTSWSLFENAGIKVSNLAGKRVGVFIAHDGWDFGAYYNKIQDKDLANTEFVIPGNNPCFLASRISSFFDFRGPSLAINTTCSGFYVALHQARQAMDVGECDYALVAAVSLSLEAHIDEFESDASEMNSFSSRAAGYISSEGCGGVLLKTLEQSEADNDHIYAVLQSTGSCTGGKTSSFALPDRDAQVALYKQVIAGAGLRAADIQYVEAHGVASPAGDAIEGNAIIETFQEESSLRKNLEECPVWVSTIKPNIGHSHAASGVYSLLKAVLSFQFNEILPIAGLEKYGLNEDINKELSAVEFLTQTQPWERQQQSRHILLTSYGFSGVNAALVIKEYDGASFDQDPKKPASQLICLSAKSEAQLLSYAQKIHDFTQEQIRADELNLLPRIAYTLQSGREEFPYRLAIVVSNMSELLLSLQSYLEKSTAAKCIQGKADQLLLTEYLEKCQSAEMLLSSDFKDSHDILLQKLAELWVVGSDIIWHKLYSVLPKKTPLPTYPFEEKTYWVPGQVQKKIRSADSDEQDGRTIITTVNVQNPANVQKQLSEIIKQIAADIVRMPIHEFEVTAELNDYGFDSVALTRLTRDINEAFSLDLTPVVFFEHTTLDRFIRFLLDEYKGKLQGYSGMLPAKRFTASSSTGSASKESAFLFNRLKHENETNRRMTAVNMSSGNDEPIAIIGISCQFPGAQDLQAFWQNLLNGSDVITEIPKERWDWRDYYGDPKTQVNRSNVRWGGFIEGAAEFDPLFFGLSPKEAELMDPQQRLLMSYIWKAIEDAGYSATSLAGSRTSIFFGIASTGYGELVSNSKLPIEGITAVGAVPSVGPNRMSYFLNFTGPSEPVETACSSSLVAIHRAVASIKNEACDMAIAGGVNLIINPNIHISLTKAGVLSEDGRCKTFSEQADGYVRGEGVGVVVLKRLSVAESDGDHIYGLIQATSCNHGGRAKSLTTPNPQAQSELLLNAYKQAGIDPRSIGFIEAHGTGTRLGDPIEISGLVGAFKKLYSDTQTPDNEVWPPAKQHCGLSSVKTNIGHLEMAAGIAGVIKTLLQLKHKKLLKNQYCDVINSHIKLENTPFYILKDNQEWSALTDSQGQTLPRRAGVSSFGFGGVNAHIVLEEYRGAGVVQNQSDSTLERPEIFVLSARSEEQVIRQAKLLLQALDDLINDGYRFCDVAYTLQLGRQPFAFRLAVVAGNYAQLRDNLVVFISGKTLSESCYAGKVQQHAHRIADDKRGDETESYEQWAEQGNYSTIAAHWIKGAEINWRRLHVGQQRYRVPLPTYPFLSENYWVPNSVGTSGSVLPKRDTLMYSLQWQALPNSTDVVKNNWRHIVIIDTSVTSEMLEQESLASSIFNQLQNNCSAADTQVTLIKNAITTRQVANNVWECGINDCKGYDYCLQRIGKIDCLIFSAGSDVGKCTMSSLDVHESLKRNEFQLLRLIKSLKRQGQLDKKLDCYVVTQDNFKLQLDEGSADQQKGAVPSGGGITGLACSIAQREHNLAVRNIDIDQSDLFIPKSRGQLLELLLSESANNRGELIKIARGKRFRQQFFALDIEGERTGLRRGGCYIIAGGSGTVGTIITRNLIQKYQAQVIWIGRKAEYSSPIQTAIRSFSEQCRPNYYQADLTDIDQLLTVITSIKLRYPLIHGAVFAGLSSGQDAGVVDIDESEFSNIVEVKAVGSINFYCALKDTPLDFMCFFSSSQAFSFSGAGNLSGYATGISYSDALIRSLSSESDFPLGLINWGFWKATADKLAINNVGVLDDEEGFACFEYFSHFLRNGQLNQILALRFTDSVRKLVNMASDSGFLVETGNHNGSEMASAEGTKEIMEAKHTMPLKADVLLSSQSKVQTESVKDSSLPLSKDWLERQLESEIADYLSASLKIPLSKIDYHAPFSDFGVDSILGVSFIEYLNSLFSIKVNSAIIFDYTNINSLTGFLLENYKEDVLAKFSCGYGKAGLQDHYVSQSVSNVDAYQVDSPTVSFSERATEPSLTGKQQNIAVIGMSGQFPGANNVDAFWKNLQEGIDSVMEYPDNYLDKSRYFSEQPQSGKTVSKWGGILEDRASFDPLFFNISPREALSMNPHQRLVLQESWKGLEDAGYVPSSLSGQNVGIYIGCEPTGYLHESFTGFSDAIIASRLSYYLNLSGPAMVVNTGCSASAVAIHLGCESLRNGESSMVIAGGVYAGIEQSTLVMLSEVGMLSPTGRCHTFDASGDGIVLSEGVGIVVLKRLEDAVADGDRIYGVIRGSGVNQDGASNGITAPNGAAQEKLITSVYERYGINPENISYVEAHGTGTRLGDPIELNALVRVFKKFTNKQNFCAVGSVKANVGHTSAAAGVVGLIKVLKSIQAKQVPGLVNFKQLNPLIDLDQSAFYVNQKLTFWQGTEGVPRVAAINSFGHSGTNVHIVVEEYLPEPTVWDRRTQESNTRFLIPVSAKNSKGLYSYVISLADFIRPDDGVHGRKIEDGNEGNYTRKDIAEEIRQFIADCLHVSKESIETNDELADYGVEELHLVRLQTWISEQFCVNVNVDIVFQKACIADLAKHIEGKISSLLGGNNSEDSFDLASIAYTLQTSREAMEIRAIFLARDIPELLEKFDAFVSGQENVDDVWFGYGKESEIHNLFSSDDDLTPVVRNWILQGQLHKVAELWARGFVFDWRILYPAGTPKRISLPTYPFAKNKYWVPNGRNEAIQEGSRASVLHLLLHRNISSLNAVRFNSIFSGEESFIEKAGDDKHHYFSGGGCLEMAMLAYAYSVDARSVDEHRKDVMLKQVRWSHPLAYDNLWQYRLETGNQPASINITLFREEAEKIGFEICGERGEEDNQLASGSAVIICQGFAEPKQISSALFEMEPNPEITELIRQITNGSPVQLINSDTNRCIGKGIFPDENRLFVELSLPENMQEEKNNFVLHPYLLSCILHSSTVMSQRGADGRPLALTGVENRIQCTTVVPVEMDVMEVLASTGNKTWALIKTSSLSVNESDGSDETEHTKDSSGSSLYLDIDLYNRTGAVCIRMRGLKLESLQWGTQQRPSDSRNAKKLADFEMESFLTKTLSEHLVIPDIEPDKPFDEYGMDSIQSVALIEKIRDKLEDVSQSLFLECGCLRELIAYCRENYSSVRESGEDREAAESIEGIAASEVELRQDADRTFAPALLRVPLQNITSAIDPAHNVTYCKPALNAISIIGLAGIFPGAENVAEFWENLAADKIVTTSLPDFRRRLIRDDSGLLENSTVYGGYLQDIEYFDFKRFRMAQEEACLMDPQLRKLLEVVWTSIQDSGVRLSEFKKRRTGIFVGTKGHSGYQNVTNQNEITEENFFTQETPALYANRISNILNIKGPSEVVEAGCSSFLVAIKNAVTAIKDDRCEQAIVATAQLYLSPAALSNNGPLYSSHALTKSFSVDSDGYIKSEVIGAIIIKPENVALRDGDAIYANIRGVGVCHGGKAPLKWYSPNITGQKLAIQEAIKESAIDPSTVEYIEVEANGSQLGDSSEVIAIQSVYGEYLKKNPEQGKTIRLGSLKPLVGHAENASTFPGLVKLIFGMKNNVAQGVYGLEALNPSIDIRPGFALLQKNEMWRDINESMYPQPKRCAINSLSIGGVNAHLILEEFPSTGQSEVINKNKQNSRTEYLFVYSDIDADKLRGQVHRHVDFLRRLKIQEKSDQLLRRMEYTLQLGRECEQTRLAVVAGTFDQLLLKLQNWLASSSECKDIYCSKLDVVSAKLPDHEEVKEWLLEKTLSPLALYWVSGGNCDWQFLHGNEVVGRCHIPGNELNKLYCWHDVVLGTRAKIDEASQQDSELDTLMMAPKWYPKNIDKKSNSPAEMMHKVIFYDWPEQKSEAFRKELTDVDDVIIMKFDDHQLPDRHMKYAEHIFQEVKNILKSRPKHAVCFQLVLPDRPDSFYLQSLVGLVKTARQENTHFEGQVLLMEKNITAKKCSAHIRDNRRYLDDVFVRYSRDQRQIQGWREVNGTACGSLNELTSAVFNDNGNILITGGAGGLGLIVARAIANKSKNTSITLTGRSDLSDSIKKQLDELRSYGALVSYVQADISDKKQVNKLLDHVHVQFGELTGIFHAAGIIQDSFIVSKKTDDLFKVMAPKVRGLYYLDQMTKDLNMGFFVLFSSLSSALGNPGQADYAIANAFMDSFSDYRNQLVSQGERHGQTISINWPLWADGGMKVDDAVEKMIKQRFYMSALPTEVGIKALDNSFRSSESQVLVMFGKVEKIKRIFLRNEVS